MSEQERERWDDGEVEAELAHEERMRQACFERILRGEACSCAYHPDLKLSWEEVEQVVEEREEAHRAAEEKCREAERAMLAARDRLHSALEAARVRRKAWREEQKFGKVSP